MSILELFGWFFIIIMTGWVGFFIFLLFGVVEVMRDKKNEEK